MLEWISLTRSGRIFLFGRPFRAGFCFYLIFPFAVHTAPLLNVVIFCDVCSLTLNICIFWFQWICWVWTLDRHRFGTGLRARPDDATVVISFKYCFKRYNLIENKIITDFDTSTRHQNGFCSSIHVKRSHNMYANTLGVVYASVDKRDEFYYLIDERKTEKIDVHVWCVDSTVAVAFMEKQNWMNE